MEKVVGRDNLITITGAGIESADAIWERALDWMGAPQTEDRSHSLSGTIGVESAAKAVMSIPLVVKGEVDLGVKAEVEAGKERTRGYRRRGLAQVVEEIANSPFVILLDDFHYMPRAVQEDAAKAVKEAVRLGVKVCTAAVWHRADDVVRANPELRGRVRAVDLSYWSLGELRRIGEEGFGALNARVDPQCIERFAREAAGSPQLMQLICLTACFTLDLREKRLIPHSVIPHDAAIKSILEQTSASTDFRSLVDVLDAGPKTRGIERKTYEFTDGTEGDVYRCLLKAVAADPPQLSLHYDDLLTRTAKLCTGDSPVGSSVVGTCVHMTRLAVERFANERALDWDDQKQILDLPDPYLLFYLRWSGRLTESMQ
ncbi:MAG: hypothetical protein IPN16_18735 [Gemmatimonadetes bacterium]|nr:hypothetical protein [Gemmatimonadota bacterium]